MKFTFYLSVYIFLLSCDPAPPPANGVKEASSWQTAIKKSQGDQLSSAMETITDAIIIQKLAGKTISITVTVEKYTYKEGADDSIELRFVRNKDLEFPIYLDASLAASEKFLNTVGFSKSKIYFAKGQEETFLNVPIVDDQKVGVDETLSIKLTSPAYVRLSTSQIDIKILDNDMATYQQKSSLDLLASKASQTLESKDPLVKSKALGSPQYTDNGIMFNGVKDSLIFTKTAPKSTVKARTLAIDFKTSQDIQRRQVIYYEGDKNSGLSVYIDDGRLFCDHYRTEANASLRKSLLHNYIKHPIASDSIYKMVLNLDSLQGTMKLWINEHMISIKDTTSEFTPSSRIYIAGVSGKTRFHDITSREKYRFKGFIQKIWGMDGSLSKEQLISLRKSLVPQHNYISISQSSYQVKENETKKVLVELRLKEVVAEDVMIQTEASGSASIHADFQIAEPIIIPKGHSGTSFEIEIVDDDVPEFDEVLYLTFKSSGPPTLSQVVIEIEDNERLDVVDSDTPWLSFNESGPRFHTNLQMESIGKHSSPKILNLGEYNFAQFSGAELLQFKYPKSMGRKRRKIPQQTIALLIKTPQDISTRQIILKENHGTHDIKVYIDKGILYYHIHSPNTNLDNWGGHTIMTKLEADKIYSLILSFDSRKRVLSAYINQTYIENTQAEISPPTLTANSTLTLGGAVEASVFHDGPYESTDDTYFRGGIFEVLFYHRHLEKADLKVLHSYLKGRYMDPKLAKIE